MYQWKTKDGATVRDTEKTIPAIMWVHDDGGREAAGYRGVAGDCATRAVAIASGLPYTVIYNRINELAKTERRGKRKKGISSARGGVYPATMRRLIAELGGTWTPCMEIGSGVTVHVAMHELPPGRLVLRLSKHFSAVIDGVLHDTFDPSRGGSRAVYGYWRFEEPEPGPEE